MLRLAAVSQREESGRSHHLCFKFTQLILQSCAFLEQSCSKRTLRSRNPEVRASSSKCLSEPLHEAWMVQFPIVSHKKCMVIFNNSCYTENNTSVDIKPKMVTRNIYTGPSQVSSLSATVHVQSEVFGHKSSRVSCSCNELLKHLLHAIRSA